MGAYKFGDRVSTETPQRRYYLRNKEKAHARTQKWRDENPGKAEAATARWRAATPQYKADRAAQQRAWRAANPDKVRDGKLRQQFGITLEEWRSLLKKQGGRCACCGKNDPGDKRGWHTDHKHGTKLIRGLVCAKCNITLGQLGDCADGVVRFCEMYLEYLARSGDVPGDDS